MKQLWLRGPNGVGKSTLGRLLKAGIPKSVYVSSGQLLRERLTDDRHVAAGNLADSNIVIEVMHKRLNQLRQLDTRVMIIDGFPRKVEEMKEWIHVSHAPDLVVSLQLSDEDVIDRLVNREICDSCGRSYNSFGNEYLRPILPAIPGRCDACADGILVRRPDDSPESIRRRLDIFHQNEMGIMNKLREYSQVNFMSIDASKGLPVLDQISRDIKSLFS